MTCNCTNGRVPGNDWTQPSTPCPECSGGGTSDRFAKSCPDCAALGIVRTCPDCEPNNAAVKMLARIDVRVSGYIVRASVVGLLSPLVTYLVTGIEAAAAVTMLAAFASVGTALWILNVIEGERRKR